MMEVRNKTLILVVTYYFKDRAMTTLRSLQEALRGTDNFQVLVIDNGSRDGLQEELQKFERPGFAVRLLSKNIGKAQATNLVTGELFARGAVPRAIISMDADITFARDSLLHLNDALLSLPNAGMLSMRYEDNGFSPEKNLPDEPTRYLGQGQRQFDIRTPRFINVAGGVFGITGRCFERILNGRFYPVPEGRVYCSDDGVLFERLRDAGCINGYLDGTRATHHGEGNYLFSDSAYGRWKLKELKKGGSTTGYFDRPRLGFEFVSDGAAALERGFYACTGRLIASGLVPGWLQRKKRKRYRARFEKP